MNLLYIDKPLVVNPGLAAAIGLNEAIVLQQCHYWQQRSQYEFNGSQWFYKSGEQWREELPFWSVPTIRRTIDKLESIGLLVSAQLHGELLGNSHNRTKWYTIDYSHKTVNACDQVDHIPSDQVDHFSTENTKETPYGGKSKIKNAIQDLDSAAWMMWIGYKSKIRDLYKTENGEQKKAAALVKLSSETGIPQASLVSHAIDEEWKGIYAPRQQQPQQPQQKRPRAFGQ